MSRTVLYTRVEDFLRDDDFIRYTLDCDATDEAHWAQYHTANFLSRNAFLRATDILLHLDECALLSPEEVAELKQRIVDSLKRTLKSVLN